MATTGTLGAAERREHLLATLRRNGTIRLSEAATELGVSPMTVRRDLDELEALGLLRKVRGGALSTTGPRPFSERRAVRSRAKALIADKALALVPDSGAIALDASTTTGTLGVRFAGKSGLTVATNSYENFLTLNGNRGLSAVLVGGEAEENTDSFVGLIACQAASSMLYQRFFTSASAVDPNHGTSEVSLQESQVKQSFAAVAKETVLCVDSSKLDQQSVALALPWSVVSIMITDLDPHDHRLDAYRSLVELR